MPPTTMTFIVGLYKSRRTSKCLARCRLRNRRAFSAIIFRVHSRRYVFKRDCQERLEHRAVSLPVKGKESRRQNENVKRFRDVVVIYMCMCVCVCPRARTILAHCRCGGYFRLERLFIFVYQIFSY